MGLEPTADCLRVQCATHCAAFPVSQSVLNQDIN